MKSAENRMKQCCRCGMKLQISLLRYGMVIVAVFGVVSSGETVYEALGRRGDLHKFHEMVNRDEVLRKLLQTWSVTVFAPTDEAISKNEEWVLGRENKVVAYHVLNLVANKTLFPFTSATSLAGSPPLYLGIKEATGYWKEKEYFVNNAKILHTENYKSHRDNEQILYVIDEILRPYLPSSSIPPTALELLQKPQLYEIREPLSAFNTRVKQEGLIDLFQKEGNHTFFIPVGASVGHSYNRQQEVDKWVIRGHVIPKNVLFTRLAGSESYTSEAFGEEVKVELSVVNESSAAGNSFILYAQSNTMHSIHGHKKGVVLSKILRPNIPVKNGVVHLIESPLMIIDITVWKFLNNEKESRLSEFLNLISYAPDFKELLMRPQEKTLFAPSNEAIRQIPPETIDHIRSNITAITNLLKLHLIMQSISTDDVLQARHVEYLSADNRNNLYFRVAGNEYNKTLTVDGGGVKAAAIQADIGAVDGMVHVVDRLLGMPYQSVYKKLQSDPELSITYNMSEQDEWVKLLDSSERRFTFFVPSDDAWSDLRRQMPTEYKQLTMGSFAYHVHKILDRHLVIGKEIHFDDINNMAEIQMLHGQFKIRRAPEDSRQHSNAVGDKVLVWEGVEARIIRPDVQAVNGVIHVISHVMMKRRDLTKSSASLKSNGRCAVSATLILFLMYSKRMCL